MKKDEYYYILIETLKDINEKATEIQTFKMQRGKKYMLIQIAMLKMQIETYKYMSACPSKYSIYDYKIRLIELLIKRINTFEKRHEYKIERVLIILHNTYVQYLGKTKLLIDEDVYPAINAYVPKNTMK